MQVDSPEGQVELIEDSVIANAQFELRTTGQAVVGKILQPRPHGIDLALYGLPNLGRQNVERSSECSRPDLKRGSHDFSGLPCGVLADRDFATRSGQLLLDVIPQLNLVLQVILDPGPERLDLLAL